MSNKYLDISKIKTPQLLEIRRILTGGVEATAETAKAKRLKDVEAQVASLQKKEQYREFVTSYGFDFDADPSYWLSFATEDRLKWICEKLTNAMELGESAFATKKTMRVPQIFNSTVELEGAELVRDVLKNRKNGNN